MQTTVAWQEEALDRLARRPACGYREGGEPSSEPTALAALALIAHGRTEAAAPALDWLLERQAPDGSVGLDATHPTPCWPTGWAALAWSASESPDESPRRRAAERACRWMLSARGKTAASEEGRGVVGHDTTLEAWPWVLGTHSWVEPTAMNLLALKAVGFGDHARVREAVRLVTDRAVASGGWNYGNPSVLGTMLRPNVQSTGLALASLHGEPDVRPTVDRAIDYVVRSLTPRTTPVSLCYALLGTAPFARMPSDSDARLEAAYREACGRGASPYSIALIVLALRGAAGPWFQRFSLNGNKSS